MAVLPSGFVHQSQLDSEIRNAIHKLGPEAVHVTYRVGADSTGEPSLYFRVVIDDDAAREDLLLDTTGRISKLLLDELRPIENWGLHPYFNFRSFADHRRRNDPAWS